MWTLVDLVNLRSKSLLYSGGSTGVVLFQFIREQRKTKLVKTETEFGTCSRKFIRCRVHDKTLSSLAVTHEQLP